MVFSQISISVAKYIKYITYKAERLVLALEFLVVISG